MTTHTSRRVTRPTRLRGKSIIFLNGTEHLAYSVSIDRIASRKSMDYARHELEGVLSDSWFGAASDYYLKECSQTSLTGETALHRLVAQSVGADAVRSFLEHYKQHRMEPDRYANIPLHKDDFLTAQNHAGATALHVAIMRNSWEMHEIVKMLLDEEPLLASIPMRCGSYPLHLLTGQSLTMIQDYDATFRILLNAAPVAASKQDCNGDTPLSLLYKNVLRFRWARELVQGDQFVADVNSANDKVEVSSRNMITSTKYLQYSLELMETTSSCDMSWHTICSTPRCPPLLVSVLLNQQRNSTYNMKKVLVPDLKAPNERDGDGRLPLHCAAAAQAVSDRCVPIDVPTVVEILIEAFPAATSAVDSSGRLALHYALDNPTLLTGRPIGGSKHPFRAVLSVVRAYPDALCAQDPSTLLYPAQKFACNGVGLRTEEDKSKKDCMALDVVYQLLRLNPSVCKYHL